MSNEVTPAMREAAERSWNTAKVRAVSAVENYQKVREWLVEIGAAPAPAPTDPKERALWLRDNRNTGPAKPHNGGKP